MKEIYYVCEKCGHENEGIWSCSACSGKKVDNIDWLIDKVAKELKEKSDEKSSMHNM